MTTLVLIEISIPSKTRVTSGEGIMPRDIRTPQLTVLTVRKLKEIGLCVKQCNYNWLDCNEKDNLDFAMESELWVCVELADGRCKPPSSSSYDLHNQSLSEISQPSEFFYIQNWIRCWRRTGTLPLNPCYYPACKFSGLTRGTTCQKG